LPKPVREARLAEEREALRELEVGVRRKEKRAALLPWIALFAFAVAMRSLRFGIVFADGKVRFLTGADELYHLRRIWFTVVNFPASLDFDFYVNFPNGAAPVWSPLFDWSIAALARMAVGSQDQGAVEWVASWVPPLLGALTVITAALLARRTFSPAAGWATGLLLAVLPGHFFVSELGQVDHHVAVALATTLLVGAAMKLAGPLGPVGRPRGAVATGVAIAGAILLWPGSLLHVLVVQVVLVAQVLAAREKAIAEVRVHVVAAMHGIAAVLLLPFCAGREWEQLGAFSPLMLSNFQPLWFGTASVLLAIAGQIWRHRLFGADRARRIGTALALAAGGLALTFASIPGLTAAVAEAYGWLSARDAFMARVAESRPLLFPNGSYDPTFAEHMLGHLFWAYPAAAFGLGVYALRTRRAEVLLLAVWSSTFFAVTLLQYRFIDSFACGFALVMGWALVEVERAVRRLARRRRALASGAMLMLGAFALSPFLPYYANVVEPSVAALHGKPLPEGFIFRQRVVLQRVALWLRSESPPTQGYLDPTLRPEYGVLCAWGNGHLLRYYGERPMVQDNFGSYAGKGFDLAREYYGSFYEDAAAEIARRVGVRYVVATRQGSGQKPIERGSMAARLLLHRGGDGSLFFSQNPANALARHRLLFLSDDSDLFGTLRGRPPWTAAVFEIVRGAEVVGRAPGRSQVTFELQLELADRQPLLYAASAPVDSAGRYQIRLPYANEGPVSSYVRAEDSYRVASGGQTHRLALSEADVREGRTVEGPSFDP
jgi:dolichyl-diphosphooligosaccharide--protein glycosyltransferase